ncbi:ROK family protein [Candidatus Dependentiae bacterium]|nr:ROK family protein [Candidatus Dependentiae bacterium]
MIQFEVNVPIKKLNNKKKLILVADIGGTKTRFAVIDLDSKSKQLFLYVVLQSSKIKDFVKVINEVLKQLRNKYKLHITVGSFAAAGKISQNQEILKLTNVNITLNSKEILEKTNLKKVFLLNDYQAAAYGLLNLDKNDFVQINKGENLNEETKVVVGAGTGLGQGVLFYNNCYKKYFAYPSEAGHSDFASRNEEELNLINFVKKIKKVKNIEWEDFLSGSGISNIYKFLAKNQKTTKYLLDIKKNNYDPILISKFRKKDLTSKRTFALFSKLHARYAKNLALNFLASGGVYIAGKIAAENIDIFKSSKFLAEFINSSKFKLFLKKTSVFIIKDYNLGLYGAAIFAEQK